MDLHTDMKKQLMAMAGISDPAEFDKMVQEMAPSMKEKVTEASTKLRQHSPFQMHFIQMLTILEEAGAQKFVALNDDLEGQIQYTCDTLQKYPEFRDVRSLMSNTNGNQVSYEKTNYILIKKTRSAMKRLTIS
jgi:hypothetical protein